MEPIRFTLDESTVVAAARLYSRTGYRKLLWLAVVVGLLFVAYTLLGGDGRKPERILLQLGLTVAGSIAVAAVVVAVLHYWVIPAQARRNFRQQKGLSDEMSLAWTETEYTFAAGKSRTEMPLANLYGYRVSDDVLMLHLSEIIYHVIPIAAFGGPTLLGDFLQRLQAAGLRKR